MEGRLDVASPSSPSQGCWSHNSQRAHARGIESATQMGQKKRLESKYEHGAEIGQGMFGSVQISHTKVGGDWARS
ncbi:hypothetical protein E2562_028584 [Oryza meyeriana var. granulata]|uniref:Uncharacterized protein n=1 Tax=Oryza meyeriana var. granulata TaxID=110450 RepID=A0A6G1D8M5_9ORYZ|nr:hypothetical protein E2562_028584 [Oryza meyeriana var. granulata]